MTATLGSPGAATQRPTPDTPSRNSAPLDDPPITSTNDPGPFVEGTFGRRVFAHFTDVAISLMVILGVGAVIGQSGDVAAVTGGRLTSATDYCDLVLERSDVSVCVPLGGWAAVWSAADIMVMAVAGFIFWLLVLVLLQGRTGATPGKYIAGLRVIDQEGNICGVNRALTRSLLWIVDALPIGWIFPVVGTIASLTNSGGRRVGDLVAGTWVIPLDRMAEVGSIGSIGAVAPVGAPELAATPVVDEIVPEPVSTEPTTLISDTAAAVDDQPSPFAPPADDTQHLSRLAREAFADTTEPEPEPEPTRSVVRSEPEPEPEPQPAAAAAPAPTYQPQWDAARNAYICWEPTRGQWLQHDTTSGEWMPIS